VAQEEAFEMGTTNSIHQLKITLEDVRPPIWRRVQVSSDTSLAALHHICQDAMGWEDCHLHLFAAQGVTYGEPSPEDYLPLRDERRVTLGRVAPREGDTFTYEYDFGDSWTHRIVVEKVSDPEPGVVYPRCVRGKRACPPEDCGGTWGYSELLAALADPAHPEREQYLDWLGDSFEPEELDLDIVNARLGALAHAGNRRHR
jgi:pRiA4b ORF-3-like protein